MNEPSNLAMRDYQHIIFNIPPQTQGENLWNLEFASWLSLKKVMVPDLALEYRQLLG
jgi:hypothetical protein